MEIEFFCRPDGRAEMVRVLARTRVSPGTSASECGARTCTCASTTRTELAHYAAACADVEYDFPFGRSELEGIANRTDFDLRQHMQLSGKDLTLFRRSGYAI